MIFSFPIHALINKKLRYISYRTPLVIDFPGWLKDLHTDLLPCENF